MNRFGAPWLAVLAVLVAACWPERTPLPTAPRVDVDNVAIGVPFELRLGGGSGSDAPRLVSSRCLDDACSVQADGWVLPMRSPVRVAFEAEFDPPEVGYVRHNTIVSGTFESPAKQPFLALLLDSSQKDPEMLVGARFELSARGAEANGTWEQPKKGRGLPVDLELHDESGSVELTRDPSQEGQWNGVAVRAGKVMFAARGRLGPVAISVTPRIEVFDAADVVDQWLTRSDYCTPGIDCTELETVVVGKNSKGELEAFFASVVRVRSGVSFFGGAGALGLEGAPGVSLYPDVDVAASERILVFAEPPPPGARLVTKLGATQHSYPLMMGR